MAEALKHLIDASTVRWAGHHLARVWPAFDRRAFEAAALAGLDGLALKQRAMQVADALQATLPADFDHAAGLIEQGLAPAREPAEGLTALAASAEGLAGWVVWPLGEFVARAGLATPARALRTLHALTQRFSAEFAIRPFIASHPDVTFPTLAQWTSDPSAHVRRLVSEGSRPRLPWGMQLRTLVADPSPTLPLLEALQDDAHPYVRRSVANHLNDIARDHPERVADWLARWLPDAPPERTALLRHASRTLVKAGHPRVLALWQAGDALAGSARLAALPRAITLGEAVTLQVVLQSSAAVAQRLVVDYVVHHVKAGGHSTPKVFKGWTLTLPAGGHVQLERRHAVRPITTRRYHAGHHRVSLQVNGQSVAETGFDLRLPPA